MCGIIGIVSTKPGIDQRSFLACRDLMVHRGPDDAGAWWSPDGCVALGHRRLSILDLTPAGHQPMLSACGRFVIVFNGEVYNYLELRRELTDLGHRFYGSGDTEVVLAAHQRWGDACLNRFNGMFALAIWDQGTPNTPASLFLARDRAGKKPLYYAHRNQTLVFASELKGIPAEFRGAIDPQALNHYLALGYIPGALCLAQGVNKLPPAYAARFRPDTGELRVWRWWTLPVHRPDPRKDINELLEETERLLRDAVRLRMRSDVPVGILLSGGLDSSLIVACAAESAAQPVKTFTMGLPGSLLDEARHAQIVAKHFGTDHHVLNVPRPELSILDEIAPFVDEPIADSSLIPAFMVSRLTAQHVKVALGGDGGDELFGGYGHYAQALADQVRLGWIPPGISQMVANLAAQLPAGLRGRNRLQALRGGPLQSQIWGSSFYDAVTRRKILAREVVDALGEDFLAPELWLLGMLQGGADPVDGMTRADFGSVLPDDYLVKVDRASMAVSLELRCPLLDVRLVEFAFGRLPSAWKAQRGGGRRLQKLLARKLLPPALDIERKQGFSIPMNAWLRGPEMGWRDRLRENLPASIDQTAVSSLVAGQAQGRTNGARLFALIMLSIWAGCTPGTFE